MKTFELRIGTPDGLVFSGEVERVICRSTTGDLAILADHCNYCTSLGMGAAVVVLPDETRREAACIGGMLSVMDGSCHILATTWEWEEDIDRERAEKARDRAKAELEREDLSKQEQVHMEAKLHRALIRLSVKD